MSNSSIEQNATNGEQTEIIPVYKEIEGNTGNDIALRAPQAVIDRMWFYAEKFAVSNLYKTNGFKNAADYFIAFIKGYELGIPLGATFDFFYQVNGKICTDGKGMLSILYTRPEVEDVIIEEGETKATVTIKLCNGKTSSASFSMDDAKKADLLDKTSWKNYPSAMLVWRALSKCVRFTAPHIVGGLTYTKEELESAVETITTPQSQDIRDFDLYITEVSPNYPNDHWFIVHSHATVGYIRRLKPEWKKIPPLEVVKEALKTLNVSSFATYKTGREAIAALGEALGLPITFPQTVTNITPMPTDKPVDTTFSIGEDPLSIQPNSTPPTTSELSGKTKYNATKNPQTAPTPQPTSKPQSAPAPQPTPKPAPTPTPQPATHPDWIEEFESFTWTHFDIANASEWEAKAGKKLSDYASLDEAKKDATRIALENCWDLVFDQATYFIGHGQNYIIFKGLSDIRMYGRSTVFKKAVGDDYYARYGVKEWQHGKLHTIGLLKVSWKRNEQGIAIADKVEVLEDEDDEISSEELEALAKVEM